jgi:hypothetical protein
LLRCTPVDAGRCAQDGRVRPRAAMVREGVPYRARPRGSAASRTARRLVERAVSYRARPWGRPIRYGLGGSERAAPRPVGRAVSYRAHPWGRPIRYGSRSAEERGLMRVCGG